ncbi:glycosyltransferase family 2 protein [Kineococcus rhizosphaerae]|uniref:Glycosyl transferase family 2 n=1 Tax=Kineococcus rhizosphaerae TaxID=559628 RepID=A0A2T0R8H8_9ACTN|nr:glycosyltransferase family 2 protein [Kineococcus rhizosphaerae]PRY17440.1 glycosyl transferase family 2 [Kineococcus rhizosphaerae]
MPLVSVGVPVYNGETYLEQTLSALLDQTFTDFEVVVCDNASTDRTPEIVEKFAAADPRIRSVRNPANIGLARNFNRVFQLSRGRYFRWAMADDLVDATNLEDCVAALEADPGAVLAVPSWDLIDADGEPARGGRELASFTWEADVAVRMQQFVDMVNGASSIAVLAYLSGLVRTEAVWTTDQLGSYPSSDHVLLAQLLLRGRFVEVPRRSLHVRLHEASAGHGIGTGDWAAVHRTFFPGVEPENLLRWRTTRYRRMWDVLERAGSSRSQRVALQAHYARTSARVLLPF